MNLTVSELIKKSIDLYKNNFKLFLTYAFLITLPSIVLALLSAIEAYFLAFQRSSVLEILFMALFVVLIVLTYFVILWLSIAKVKVVAARYENKNVLTIKEEIKDAQKYIVPSFVATLISGALVLAGFLLLIIPGVILSILFSFVFYAVILDSKKGMEAVKFSKNLVSGHWWAVLWRLLLPGLLFLLISGALKGLLGFFSGVTNLFLFDAVIAFTAYVVDIFFAPFLIAAQIILYFELKKIKSAAPAEALSSPVGPPL